MDLKATETAAINPANVSGAPPVEHRAFSASGRPVAPVPAAGEAAAADPKAGTVPRAAVTPVGAAAASSSPGNGEKPAASTAPPATGEKPAEGEQQPPRPTGREFAALKKRERAALEVEERVKPYREAVQSGDVTKIMQAFGLSDEKIVEMYIAAANKPAETGPDGKSEENPLAKKLEELEAKLSAKEKADADRAIQDTVNGHYRAIEATVAGAPEKYEELGAADPRRLRAITEGEYSDPRKLVFDVMLERHKATGEYLTYAQAAELAEAGLAKTRDELGIPKRGGKAAPQSDGTSAATPAATGDDATARMRQAFRGRRVTVTNSAASAAPTTATRTARRGEEADRRFRERVAALRGGQ